MVIGLWNRSEGWSVLVVPIFTHFDQIRENENILYWQPVVFCLFATNFGTPCWGTGRMQNLGISMFASYVNPKAPYIFLHSQWILNIWHPLTFTPPCSDNSTHVEAALNCSEKRSRAELSRALWCSNCRMEKRHYRAEYITCTKQATSTCVYPVAWQPLRHWYILYYLRLCWMLTIQQQQQHREDRLSMYHPLWR